MMRLSTTAFKKAAVFTLAALIVFLNGIPFYSQYGFNQFVSTVFYRNGAIPVNPDLYMGHIFEYFSRIPLMRFSNQLVNFLGIEAYRIDHLYYWAFTALAFMAVYLFLRTLRFNVIVSFLLTTWFTVFNPLRNFIYGYQYEVGRGTSTLGLISFAVMTMLLSLQYRAKAFWHAFFLIVLYGIHPLNTLLYMGFVCLLIFYAVLFPERRENRWEFFQKNVPSLILMVLFLGMSLVQYGGIYRENPERVFHLTSIINGFGERGGFFFSWLNRDKLIDFWAFTPSFFLLIYGGWKRRYIDRHLFLISFSMALYSLAVCAVNYLAYHWGIYSLLPLDLSRMFALQIPLAFICLAQIIRGRYAEEGRDIAFISLLLTACLPQIPLLLPFLVVFLLYGRREKLLSYCLFLFPALVLMILFEYKHGTLALSELSWGTQRMKYGLAAVSIFFVLLMMGERYLGRRLPVGLAGLFLTVLMTLHGYRSEFLSTWKGRIANDRNYGELDDYLRRNTAKEDIVLIEDIIFGYMAIRPHFANYNSLAYGIYMGNLDRLEDESSLIWDIYFDDAFIQKTFDRHLSNTRDIAQYMKKTLLSYTPEKIQSIRRRYPNFRFIALEEGDQFLREDLPVEEVFANERFHLYKLASP